jgi:hypothetical protein
MHALDYAVPDTDLACFHWGKFLVSEFRYSCLTWRSYCVPGVCQNWVDMATSRFVTVLFGGSIIIR